MTAAAVTLIDEDEWVFCLEMVEKDYKEIFGCDVEFGEADRKDLESIILEIDDNGDAVESSEDTIKSDSDPESEFEIYMLTEDDPADGNNPGDDPPAGAEAPERTGQKRKVCPACNGSGSVLSTEGELYDCYECIQHEQRVNLGMVTVTNDPSHPAYTSVEEDEHQARQLLDEQKRQKITDFQEATYDAQGTPYEDDGDSSDSSGPFFTDTPEIRPEAMFWACPCGVYRLEYTPQCSCGMGMKWSCTAEEVWIQLDPIDDVVKEACEFMYNGYLQEKAKQDARDRDECERMAAEDVRERTEGPVIKINKAMYGLRGAPVPAEKRAAESSEASGSGDTIRVAKIPRTERPGGDNFKKMCLEILRKKFAERGMDAESIAERERARRDWLDGDGPNYYFNTYDATSAYLRPLSGPAPPVQNEEDNTNPNEAVTEDEDNNADDMDVTPLTEVREDEMLCASATEDDPEWLLLDSGCAKTSCPDTFHPEQPTVQGAVIWLRTATGEVVSAGGKRSVPFQMENGDKSTVRFTVGGVNKAILSVAEVNDLGHKVVFDKSGSYVEKDGKRLTVERKNNTFWMPVWKRSAKVRPSRPMDPNYLCPIEEVSQVKIEEIEESQPAKGLRVPATPTPAEWEEHMLTHRPRRDWCDFRVKGTGTEDPHRRQEDRVGTLPEVEMDYFHINKKSDVNLATGLTVSDVQSTAVAACLCHKGPKEYAVNFVLATLNDFGYLRLALKTDQEPAILALAEEVKAKRDRETVLKTGKKYSSQSMGKVENANRRIQDQIRVMILRLEDRVKIDITAESAILPWLVRHSAWILTKFDRNSSGRTAHQELRGKSYEGTVVEFGESIWWRDPATSQDKMEGRWLSGTWVGKLDKSDEHVVLVEKDVYKVRSIKRKPMSHRWSVEEHKAITAAPWTSKGEKTDDVKAVVRKKYITRQLVMKHGPTRNCHACAGTGPVHSAPCRRRFERIFEKEVEVTPVPAPVSVDPAKEEKEQREKDEAEQKEENATGVESSTDKDVAKSPEKKDDHDMKEDMDTGSPAKNPPTDVEMGSPPRPPISQDLTKRLFGEEAATSPTGERVNPKVAKTAAGVETLEEINEIQHDMMIYLFEELACEFEDVSKLSETDLYAGKVYYGAKSGRKLDNAKLKLGRETEMGQVENFKAVKVVPISQAKGKKHVRMKWLDDYKTLESGEEIIRSRLVCQEVAYTIRYDVFAAALEIKSVRIIISVCASKPNAQDRQLARYDMSVAFFHATMDEEVYCSPPAEANVPPGFCWMLLRAFYGTRRASTLWQEKYTEVLLANGFCRGSAVPVIFYSESLDVTIAVHGDDFLAEGRPGCLDQLDDIMKKNFLVKILNRLGPNASTQATFLNRTICWSAEGFTLEADEKHARLLIEALGMHKAKGVDSPGSRAAGKNLRDAEEPLEPDWAEWYRSLAGRELYLSQDRYDMQQASSTLMKEMSKPTNLGWERLKRTVRYLCQFPRLVYHFKYQSLPENIVTDSDSDWAGDPDTRKSTTGFYESFGSHCLDHGSSRQATIALSSGEAEYGAIVKTAAGALETQSILKEVGINVGVVVNTDSSAARGICHRRGVGKVRHLSVKQLWVQERVKNKELVVNKIGTAENRGDIGTKPLEGKALEQLLDVTALECHTTWRASGLVASLLIVGAGGAHSSVQQMVVGSTVGWFVDSIIDVLKSMANITIEVRLWMIMLMTIAVFVFGWKLSAWKHGSLVDESEQEIIEQTPEVVQDERGAGAVQVEPRVDPVPVVHAEAEVGRPDPARDVGVQREVEVQVIRQRLAAARAQEEFRFRLEEQRIAAEAQARWQQQNDAALREQRRVTMRRMTVPQLKVELRARNIPVTGLKDDLIERLLNHGY